MPFGIQFEEDWLRNKDIYVFYGQNIVCFSIFKSPPPPTQNQKHASVATRALAIHKFSPFGRESVDKLTSWCICMAKNLRNRVLFNFYSPPDPNKKFQTIFKHILYP